MAQVRNVDPEVGRTRAMIAVAVRQGDEGAAEQYRRELYEAKIMAAAMAAAAKLPELTPEKREIVRAAFQGAPA